MTQNKTIATTADVTKFLQSVDNPIRKRDGETILAMMEKITAESPVIWGTSLVGFGQYHYKYESGREGGSFLTGFSPRKTSMSIYIMPGFEPYEALLKKLGKYKTGKSCLYINKFEDIDIKILEKIIAQSVKDMRKKYKT